VAQEKVRLGGMALSNGVLVHGPTAWAAAVRLPDGELKVRSGRKRLRAGIFDRPVLRGPARLLEAFSVLPQLRRALPEARFAFERPSVAASVLGSAAAAREIRDSERLSPALKELATSVLAVAPAAVALGGSDLAAYHGAEHVAIGTYEHGARAAKEHERCGSHLVGPILVTSAVARLLTAPLRGPLAAPARALASLGAVAAATELFVWMTRNPDDPVATALAKPGHALQHRLATAEPTPEQLAVAEAAVNECLRLESTTP
jgi:uncharacterized protein YqhQ